MPNIQPIIQENFADKCWNKPQSFKYFAKDVLCPITLREMMKALIGLPIGFTVQDDQPIPVVLQGFKQGQNLLVNPQGQWVASYLPAAYRAYPFTLAQADEDKLVLCIDSESDLVTDGEGEVFFDEEGNLTPATQGQMNLLTEIYKDRQITNVICKVLHDKELIQPWNIQVKNGDKQTNIEGIYRVDEQALNALDQDAFQEIRQAGALPLIYSQLLSMQHLPSLIRLAEQQTKQSVEVPDIDKLFGEGTDLFKF